MAMSAISRIHLLTGHINKLSDLYTDEQLKLATGFKSQYYSGLDIKRVESLSVRNRLNEVEGYANTISIVKSRLEVTDTILDRMSELRSSTRNEMFEANYETVDGSQVIEQITAEARLHEMLEHFNRQIGGRYIFGGAETNRPPVESFDTIMDGDAKTGAHGFKTVMQEFIDVNLGVDNPGSDRILGRLTMANDTAGNITLTEDLGVTHRYGLKILSASSDITNMTTAHTNAYGVTVDAIAGALTDPVIGSIPSIGVAGDFTLTRGSETLTLNVGASTTTQEVIDFVNNSGMARASTASGSLEVEFFADVTSGGAALTGGNALDSATNMPSPDSVQFSFAGTPPVTRGSSVTVQFTLGEDISDGIHEVTLYAGDATTTLNDEFPIGTDAITTANNFETKLQERIEQIAQTELRAKAMFDGADAFFDIDGTGLPQRLDTSAIAVEDVVAAPVDGNLPTNNTVVWYNGDPSLKDAARSTVQIRLDTSVTVDVGMQANEDGFVNFLKPLAVLSAGDLSPATTTVENTDLKADLYHAMRVRVGQDLPITSNEQTLEQVWQDVSTVRTIILATEERHQFTADFSKTVLADVELADQEEAAATLLTIQNKLEASYQTTALLRNLSLVRYL